MRGPRDVVVDLVHELWDRAGVAASVTAGTRRARRFAAFGPGSLVCFPWAALYGEAGIRIGSGTLVGPFTSISAGMVPGQVLLSDAIVSIGDRCLIGRGSSIVGHWSVVIEDDVFTGPNVYVTDQNHAWADPSVPIGRQAAPEAAVRVGAGSWLGTGVVVLPGVTIGRHVAGGAGSVVTRDLPDHCVAAGTPARVVGETGERPGPRAPAAVTAGAGEPARRSGRAAPR
jgi:acetyltransferase-like isoleucine patch superfamily enzyme